MDTFLKIFITHTLREGNALADLFSNLWGSKIKLNSSKSLYVDEILLGKINVVVDNDNNVR